VLIQQIVVGVGVGIDVVDAGLGQGQDRVRIGGVMMIVDGIEGKMIDGEIVVTMTKKCDEIMTIKAKDGKTSIKNAAPTLAHHQNPNKHTKPQIQNPAVRSPEVLLASKVEDHHQSVVLDLEVVIEGHVVGLVDGGGTVLVVLLVVRRVVHGLPAQ